MKTLVSTVVLLVSGLFFVLALAWPADAMKSKYPRSVICQILKPCQIPAKYAKGPFRAKPVVREISLRALQSRCGGSGHAAGSSDFPYSYLGCSQFQGSRCIVHVPSDVRAISIELYNMILQHELAHCRGWDHARY